jgi:hypothetical protein
MDDGNHRPWNASFGRDGLVSGFGVWGDQMTGTSREIRVNLAFAQRFAFAAVRALRSVMLARCWVVVLKPCRVDRGKNQGLQVARALAALCVAYFHSYIALRIFSEGAQHPISFFKDWGFLGVNFFFAISGFVICMVVSRPTFTLRSFIIRRVFGSFRCTGSRCLRSRL